MPSALRKACVGTAGVGVFALVSSAFAAGTVVRAPLNCSRGPSEQSITVAVTVPRTVEQASRYTVRIDGIQTGKIAAFGLNHIHDIATDYVIPPGTKYVTGSAHVIPDTGTPNLRPGARVWYEPGLIKTVLADRVESGSSYTHPSIEFQLEVTAAAGATLSLQLREYRVTANAVIVGDVVAICEPVPKRFVLGETMVTAPAAPVPAAPAPAPPR